MDVIDPFEARKALLGEPVSLSMGYKKDLIEPIVEGDIVRIGKYELEKDILEEISEERFVYKLPSLERIAYFDKRFYRLFPVKLRTAPTLEISGVFMHAMKDTTPRKDARSKVSLLNIKPGHKVLDTCMGLGYTAIHAHRLGANVTTVEISRTVMKIANENPRSEELKNVKIVNADVYDYVLELNDEEFDRIIHDPPRMALAGELYSLDFYKELYRILKPRGILYHYVGDPGGRYRKKKLRVGVAKRLRLAGFTRVKRDERTKGLRAFK